MMDAGKYPVYLELARRPAGRENPMAPERVCGSLPPIVVGSYRYGLSRSSPTAEASGLEPDQCWFKSTLRDHREAEADVRNSAGPERRVVKN
jgi:hypothetical protein